tara:strand:+ start:698 stop:1333 length:636 start_codon:yes stop_codon:yes gene_type:complete
MSIKAMNWAWEQNLLSPTSKIILLKLADTSDDSGVCWPSIGLLADSCGVSRRTIQRHLLEFIDDKLLIVTKRTRPNKSQTSNFYKLPIHGVSNCHGGDVTDDTPRTTILNNKKKSAIKEDFKPDEKSILWLKTNYPDKTAIKDIETQKFINYFIDKGDKRTGWQRSWMNWMSNARQKTKYLSSGRTAATNEEIFNRIAGDKSIFTKTSKPN